MSVRRYRDVVEMPPPPAGDRGDPRTYAQIKELWRFAARFGPPLFQAGVYRYRTIEESNEARERATIARMRAMRATRTDPR